MSQLPFRNLPCECSFPSPRLHLKADRSTATKRLAFYYRIFPILPFRRVLSGVAVVSLLYMIAIVLTVIFQWYLDSASLLSVLKLRHAVVPSTTRGIVSMKTSKVTASKLMISLLVAALSTPVSIS